MLSLSGRFVAGLSVGEATGDLLIKWLAPDSFSRSVPWSERCLDGGGEEG